MLSVNNTTRFDFVTARAAVSVVGFLFYPSNFNFIIVFCEQKKVPIDFFGRKLLFFAQTDDVSVHGGKFFYNF